MKVNFILLEEWKLLSFVWLSLLRDIDCTFINFSYCHLQVILIGLNIYQKILVFTSIATALTLWGFFHFVNLWEQLAYPLYFSLLVVCVILTSHALPS